MSELVDRTLEFVKQNVEILGKLKGLTIGVLEDQLKEAIKCNKGYYKNNKGHYVFVKGIEITNDTSNLCRMGFNGEDRGVWIHYSEITDKRVMYDDVPVFVFTSRMNPNVTAEDEILKPISKEEFDAQVVKTTNNIIAEYKEELDPVKCLKIVQEEIELLKEIIQTDEPFNMEV